MTFEESTLYSKLVSSPTSNLGIILYIKVNNVDINVRFDNPNYFNILTACFASSSYDLDRKMLIDFTIKNGIDINAFVIDNHGLKRNALWVACFHGNFEAVKLLVERGIELTDGLLSAKAYTKRFAEILMTHPHITDYMDLIIECDAFEILPEPVREIFVF